MAGFHSEPFAFLFAFFSGADDVHLKGSYRDWPNKAFFIPVAFGDAGYNPRHPYAVASHPHILLRSVGACHFKSHGARILEAQLEHLAYFHPPPYGKFSGSVGA